MYSGDMLIVFQLVLLVDIDVVLILPEQLGVETALTLAGSHFQAAVVQNLPAQLGVLALQQVVQLGIRCSGHRLPAQG